MNAYSKKLLVAGLSLLVLFPSLAVAQKSAGGVIGDARLRPGTWNSVRSSQYRTRSQPTYRNSAPIVSHSEQAPTAVAQAPSERRSFSYDPAQEPSAAKSLRTPCDCGTVTTKSSTPGAQSHESAQAEVRASEGRRSFSYEPSLSDAPTSERTYSTPSFQSSPRMQSSRAWSRSSGTKAERNNQRN